MADKEILVTITKVSPNKCKVDPRPFVASRGDFVTFEFKEARTAMINFRNGKSPFDQTNFVVGRKPVRADAGSFLFDVVWVDADGKGAGDGSGEIVP